MTLDAFLREYGLGLGGAAKASWTHGLVLAFAFGLGRGLPFLIAGGAASAVSRLTALGRWQRAVQIARGCALLLVSVYYARAFSALL